MIEGAVRRAVVIGASGGIGGALAAALAARGIEVHGLARRGAVPPGCIAGRIDLTDPASIEAAAASVGGEAELVIVASGLLHGRHARPEKSLRDMDAAGMAEYFAVNAAGPALAARHFVPLLPRNRPAWFAALSARVGSISDNRLGGWYGYRASKAALNQIVRTLAIELARSHPRAVAAALHPGTVATPLSRPFTARTPADRLLAPEASAARLLETLRRLTPAQSGGCFAYDGSAVPP
jgi:NAD(P)-dependent dehydrogenase (short-subunit alcohol dehydrogenase family)